MMSPSIDHDTSMAGIYRRDPARAQESLMEALNTWSYEEIQVLFRQLSIAFPPQEQATNAAQDSDTPSPNSLVELCARLGLRLAITPAVGALARSPAQAA